MKSLTKELNSNIGHKTKALCDSIVLSNVEGDLDFVLCYSIESWLYPRIFTVQTQALIEKLKGK